MTKEEFRIKIEQILFEREKLYNEIKEIPIDKRQESTEYISLGIITTCEMVLNMLSELE